MTRLYEDESRLEDLRESGRDREISLGTGLILGIFLALAVVCAIFFGFGYALGRRSAAPAVTMPVPSSVESQRSTGVPKPAPGSPTGTRMDQQQNSEDTTSGSSASPQRGATRVTASLGDRAPGAAAGGAWDRAASSAKPDSKPAAEMPVAAGNGAPPAPGTSYVQVAAVSHKEDADLLLGSLRKRGYSATVRQMPSDKLLHVQIGPMSNKKEADAMRKRLQADGYNAIVK